MRPDVSVVIPTGGRPSLAAAIESALNQKGVNVEVLIVWNAVDDPGVSVWPPGSRLLRGGVSRDANASRQQGIESARASYVALLDDDDVWHPDKLAKQLVAAQDLEAQSPGSWIVGCGMRMIRTNQPAVLAPRTFGEQPDSIAKYLFYRRHMVDPRHQLQSSTLLFPRELALRIPFQSGLRQHQDWQWLLQVGRELSPPVHIVSEYLVDYLVNMGITSSSSSAVSVEWGRVMLADDPRLLGDFLATVAFNMAMTEGSPDAAREYLRYARRLGKPGVPAALRATIKLLLSR